VIYVTHVYQFCCDRWVCAVWYFSTSNTVLQSIVPDEMRGCVTGIWALIFGDMILRSGAPKPASGSKASMQGWRNSRPFVEVIAEIDRQLRR
jgi:hypothetical protein